MLKRVVVDLASHIKGFISVCFGHLTHVHALAYTVTVYLYVQAQYACITQAQFHLGGVPSQHNTHAHTHTHVRVCVYTPC